MHGSQWDGCKETGIQFGGGIHVPLVRNAKVVRMDVGMFCLRSTKEVMEREAWEARAGAVAIWSTMFVGTLQEVRYGEDNTTSKLTHASLTLG